MLNCNYLKICGKKRCNYNFWNGIFSTFGIEWVLLFFLPLFFALVSISVNWSIWTLCCGCNKLSNLIYFQFRRDFLWVNWRCINQIEMHQFQCTSIPLSGRKWETKNRRERKRQNCTRMIAKRFSFNTLSVAFIRWVGRSFVPLIHSLKSDHQCQHAQFQFGLLFLAFILNLSSESALH